jgi:hypothetical protein
MQIEWLMANIKMILVALFSLMVGIGIGAALNETIRGLNDETGNKTKHE